MSTIHNRIDSNNVKSSVRWGYGFFKDNTFNYSYPESINIKGTNSHSRVNDIPLFSGLRKFKVKTKNGFLMTANNATQKWKLLQMEWYILMRNGEMRNLCTKKMEKNYPFKLKIYQI